MKLPGYRYAATVHRVLDADTYDLDIDLGFRVRVRAVVRALGIHAPASGPRAEVATRRACTLLTHGSPLIIETQASPHDGGWLATVYLDGRPLTDLWAEAAHPEDER